MSRKLFVNLVVNDLARSKAFFEGLGFGFNPQFTNEQAAAMIVSDEAFFMLQTPESMKRFSDKPACDNRTQLAAIYAFSVGSRAEVNAIADKALAQGATQPGEPQDHGFMYGRSFLDPDGHHWEVLWMDPAFVQ